MFSLIFVPIYISRFYPLALPPPASYFQSKAVPEWNASFSTVPNAATVECCKSTGTKEIICSAKSRGFWAQPRSEAECFLMRCNHVHLQYKIFKLLEIICSVKSWGFWANPPSHLHLSKNIIQISSPDVKTQRLFHWSKNNLKRWWTPSAKPVYEKNFLFFTEILDMLDIF